MIIPEGPDQWGKQQWPTQNPKKLINNLINKVCDQKQEKLRTFSQE